MKEPYIIAEQDGFKTLSGEDYNYVFNMSNGYFCRWGATKEEDPRFSPCGPEIADIEISTACSGLEGIPCRFCYKSNKTTGDYMSFEKFRTIFHNLVGAKIKLILEDESEIELDPSHICKTQRGNVKAEELVETDEILDL